MSINFPTSLDTLTNPVGTDPVTSPDHAVQHANANDAIEALEAKVGVTSSAVTSTHDYKLSGVSAGDKAVSKTGTETLTNKTLTTPTIADFTNSTHTHQNNAGGGQLVATSVFASGTVPTARLGSGTANATTFLRGDQTWQLTATAKFGGDGSDGAFTISSGTTTTNLGTTKLTVKNYSSVSITGTALADFSNPNTTGSIVVWKVSGNVTITSSATPCLSMVGIGATGGLGGTSTNGAQSTGSPGSDGLSFNGLLTHAGAGGIGSTSTGGATGAALSLTDKQYLGTSILTGIYPDCIVGAAGGGGGTRTAVGSGPATGGIGGFGGGCLIIECAGALNFTGVASVAGGNAAQGSGSGVTYGAAGGGGGGAGSLWIFYNTLTANSGTVTITGGSGAVKVSAGVAGSPGGGGGGSSVSAGTNGGADDGSAGGSGISLIAKNTQFA